MGGEDPGGERGKGRGRVIMEKAKKYRLVCEAVSSNDIDPDLLDGIECDKFVLLTEETFAMQDLSILDLAKMIASNDDAMEAAYIAEGLTKAKRHAKSNTIYSLVDTIAGKLIERLNQEDDDGGE